MKLCPRCNKFGFIVEMGFNRPHFRCQGCDYTWSKGHTGEPYFSNAQNLKIGQTYKDFREFVPC